MSYAWDSTLHGSPSDAELPNCLPTPATATCERYVVLHDRRLRETYVSPSRPKWNVRRPNNARSLYQAKRCYDNDTLQAAGDVYSMKSTRHMMKWTPYE